MNSEYRISEEDETLALRTIGWIVANSARADRMLALTGLDDSSLRAGLSDPATLGALMDFVINHEPDLRDCVQALGVAPEAFVAARERIGRAGSGQ